MNLTQVTWVEEPRPAGNPTEHAFDHELYDVVPIRFYPDDLPDLIRIPLPAVDLCETKRLARRWLYIAAPTPEELTAA